MEELLINTVDLYLEEFPTYEDLPEGLYEVVQHIEERLEEMDYLTKVEGVEDFTKRFTVYQNILRMINAVDRYLQQQVEVTLVDYIYAFVNEPVFSLYCWETPDVAEMILPMILDTEFSVEMLEDNTTRKIGLRESFVKVSQVIDPERVEEFMGEYLDIVSEDVLMYTVENMLHAALSTGDFEDEFVGHIGVHLEKFKDLLLNKSTDFDNMEELSQYLISNRRVYTREGAD